MERKRFGGEIGSWADSGSAEGLLLLNSSLKPIFANRVAAEILSYPQKAEAQKNSTSFWQTK